MKDAQFPDNLNKLFTEEEIVSLMDEEIEVPVPEKIQNMIDRAKKNLAKETEKTKDILEFARQDGTVTLAECAIEGSEERKPANDPLKEIIKED